MSNSMLITGAAGFIGCNAAVYFAQRGWKLTLIDNFSREGTARNGEWLRESHGLAVENVDLRDARRLAEICRMESFDVVLHMAGQVAVTASVDDPYEDFQVNAGGTINLLEALRKHSPGAHVVYASTNKVYGSLDQVAVEEGESRYRYKHLKEGVGENLPLEFRTPYGCSKGAADQYVVDYARTFDLEGTSVRQSCIYGPRQIGVEDQGWVAWFVRAAMSGADPGSCTESCVAG